MTPEASALLSLVVHVGVALPLVCLAIGASVVGWKRPPRVDRHHARGVAISSGIGAALVVAAYGSDLLALGAVGVALWGVCGALLPATRRIANQPTHADVEERAAVLAAEIVAQRKRAAEIDSATEIDRRACDAVQRRMSTRTRAWATVTPPAHA